jgi:ABC-type iron transport system FetAB permease component
MSIQALATSSPNLTWVNVLIGLLFIVFDSILSLILGLGIGGSLIVASLRCIVQLSIMGLILDKVFASHNIWGVFGIASESDYCHGHVRAVWLTRKSCSTSLEQSRLRTTSRSGDSQTW